MLREQLGKEKLVMRQRKRALRFEKLEHRGQSRVTELLEVDKVVVKKGKRGKELLRGNEGKRLGLRKEMEG